MKKIRTILLIFAVTLLVSCPETAPPPSSDIAEDSTPLRLWYNYPAEEWMTQALPIGNGELGAMFFGGITRERIQFNEKTLWSGTTTQRGVFQNFGDVYIDITSHGSRVTDYYRELSLNDAVGTVSYTAGGVSYRREYFSSFPDQVVVMRYTAPGNSGKLSFKAEMIDGRFGGEKTASGNTIILKGKLATVNYEARLVVLNEGGTVTADNEAGHFR